MLNRAKAAAPLTQTANTVNTEASGPRYTSGAQNWPGKAEILKSRATVIRNKAANVKSVIGSSVKTSRIALKSKSCVLANRRAIPNSSTTEAKLLWIKYFSDDSTEVCVFGNAVRTKAKRLTPSNAT